MWVIVNLKDNKTLIRRSSGNKIVFLNFNVS